MNESVTNYGDDAPIIQPVSDTPSFSDQLDAVESGFVRRRDDFVKLIELEQQVRSQFVYGRRQATDPYVTWPAAGGNARAAWRDAHSYLVDEAVILKRRLATIGDEIEGLEDLLETTREWDKLLETTKERDEEEVLHLEPITNFPPYIEQHSER